MAQASVRRCSSTSGRSGDAGQASVLMLGVLALAIAVLVALLPLAQGAIERSRAQTAADAAALAGAAEGEDAAREMAEANGAHVVTWRSAGDDVWVEVRLGKARAVAKARRD